ncbi:mannosyltransferase family protein [Archangium violaceum]|uniref:mannosyltransferase family protein n=1 Tax=Archangium violaceum TaxID=83451 RepID=UPI001EF11B67|nr:mannosyltransferase family protein [Archangium violaceum]
MRLFVSRTLALVILTAVIACAAAAGAGAWRFHHKNPQAPVVRLDEYVVMGWVGWDSSWYMRIAQEGYQYVPGAQSSVAFFPLYPLAIRAVEQLGPNVYQAGVLVTLLCGPLALLLFSRWARLRVKDETTALQAGLLLALYPFTFFLYGVMYSDALFLLLVVGAFGEGAPGAGGPAGRDGDSGAAGGARGGAGAGGPPARVEARAG